MMLGVRRPGVTEALKRLEKQDLVIKRRGIIVIRDRKRLQMLAGGGYGLAEAEYERLIGTPLSQPLQDLALAPALS
jgi:hypothetical protein